MGAAGSPPDSGGVVQLVVFGLLAAWYLVRVRRPGAVYHLVALAAMVWMVVAMPALMGVAAGADGASGHGHSHGAADAHPVAPALAGPAPEWMRLVTVAFVVVLCAAALAWVVAAARRAPVLRNDASVHVLMSLGMAGMLFALL
ncbi:hypothetical protein BJF78_34985 [Pseudonocardia sp. CNS-139]|nr:hypothetical protein BJF78_34985 [Pseudonocardia sp. CNS-139]